MTKDKLQIHPAPRVRQTSQTRSSWLKPLIKYALFGILAIIIWAILVHCFPIPLASGRNGGMQIVLKENLSTQEEEPGRSHLICKSIHIHVLFIAKTAHNSHYYRYWSYIYVCFSRLSL